LLVLLLEMGFHLTLPVLASNSWSSCLYILSSWDYRRVTMPGWKSENSENKWDLMTLKEKYDYAYYYILLLYNRLRELSGNLRHQCQKPGFELWVCHLQAVRFRW
jgi:hypothetical protein